MYYVNLFNLVQLFILFKRPLHEASAPQLTVLATSLITAALGPTEWFLWSKQSQAVDIYEAELSYEYLGFKEKLSLLGKTMVTTKYRCV